MVVLNQRDSEQSQKEWAAFICCHAATTKSWKTAIKRANVDFSGSEAKLAFGEWHESIKFTTGPIKFQAGTRQ